jgi:uncharacterized membrane protein YkoI
MWVGCAVVMGLALAVSAAYAADEAKPEVKAKPEAKAKVELPEAAAKALKDAFPKATVDDVKMEKEEGVTVYEVELEEGKAEMEVEVAADGTILEVETDIEMKDVPEAAAKAIQAAAEGAKIKEVSKEEVRAEIKKEGETAKIVKLEKAKTLYGAEIVKGDQKGEIEVAADGTVVEPLKWKEKGKEKHEEKGEEKEEHEGHEGEK